MTNPHDKAIEAAAKAICIAHGYKPSELDTVGRLSGLPLWKDHKGCAEAAIAAYERAMWRPIEEAPHNRTVILGWRDWRDGKWCMEVGAAAWGERVGDYSNRSQHGSATHFRPLPPVPEGE